MAKTIDHIKVFTKKRWLKQSTRFLLRNNLTYGWNSRKYKGVYEITLPDDWNNRSDKSVYEMRLTDDWNNRPDTNVYETVFKLGIYANKWISGIFVNKIFWSTAVEHWHKLTKA